MTPKYPDIFCGIDRTGPGGNIYAIVGRCVGEMREAGIDRAEIKEFTSAVFATRSYADALRVCGEWVTMPDDAGS